MPIYEYQCRSCDHELEALQKMSDDVLIHCPECNEAALKKKISAAAFKLKGSGWYETDFKNSGAKPKNAEADKKAPSKAGNSKATSKPKSSCSAASNQAA